MAGWDLSADRSGKNSESKVPVISKKGKADLRYALYQALPLPATNTLSGTTQTNCVVENGRKGSRPR